MLVCDLSNVWGDRVAGPFPKSFSNPYILVNVEMNLENIVNALVSRIRWCIMAI